MTTEAITSISDEELIVLRGDDEMKREKIIESVFEGLNDDQTESLLGGFCTSDQRETFSTFDGIEEVTFDSPTKGQLDVSFSGFAHHGCKDAHRNYEYCKVVGFEVDPLKMQVRFETEPPEIFEREGEEF